VEHARAARTTIALKILMAVSGLIFIGFVLAHMYGNLRAFAGHDAFNEYAQHLRTFGTPLLPNLGFLTVMRVALVVALVVHVTCGVILWRRARRARTVKYVVRTLCAAVTTAAPSVAETAQAPNSTSEKSQRSRSYACGTRCLQWGESGRQLGRSKAAPRVVHSMLSERSESFCRRLLWSGDSPQGRGSPKLLFPVPGAQERACRITVCLRG